MNPIGRMCGVEVVFGGRWDDLRGSAPFRSTWDGVTGYYDQRSLSPSLIPAPVVALKIASPEDTGAAQAIYYNDDEGRFFGSVILSGGQIAPLSETVHEDADAWIASISKALRDPNLDIVHIPIGVQVPKVEKLRDFDLTQTVERKGLPRLSSASNSRNLFISLLFGFSLLGIGGGTWAYLTDQFSPPPPAINLVTEYRLPLFGEILDGCRSDLSVPWPAPPEWEVVTEGCVADWNGAQMTGLTSTDQVPHAYRLYEISTEIWDPYLSRLSFLRISENFPGRVVEGTNQFLLYIPYELSTRIVDNAYMPDDDPAEIIRARFVGAVDITGGAGMEALSASIPLELYEVLERLSGERITPSHVFRDVRGQLTGLRFGPEQVLNRQVRVD